MYILCDNIDVFYVRVCFVISEKPFIFTFDQFKFVDSISIQILHLSTLRINIPLKIHTILHFVT